MRHFFQKRFLEMVAISLNFAGLLAAGGLINLIYVNFCGFSRSYYWRLSVVMVKVFNEYLVRMQPGQKASWHIIVPYIIIIGQLLTREKNIFEINLCMKKIKPNQFVLLHP